MFLWRGRWTFFFISHQSSKVSTWFFWTNFCMWIVVSWSKMRTNFLRQCCKGTQTLKFCWCRFSFISCEISTVYIRNLVPNMLYSGKLRGDRMNCHLIFSACQAAQVTQHIHTWSQTNSSHARTHFHFIAEHYCSSNMQFNIAHQFYAWHHSLVYS